jgi:hypothetical protein
VAALAMMALQLLIALTGNYTSFNLLTVLLCLPLLDDDFWPALLRATAPATVPPPSAPWRRGTLPLATVLFSLSLLQAAATTGIWHHVPRPVLAPLEWARPLRSINGYGLFAVMTTERPEIVVEGSLDGEEWRPYSFRWKPGPLDRRPRFVAPHQPRLDWQMWFAALSDYRSTPWMGRLLERLLDGEPTVLDLLATDPFDGARPRLVRARLYRYRFTDWQTLRREGRWWRRELLGPYSPVLSRRGHPGDG